MFKECLRAGETPFIITEDLRDFYIRGLRDYKTEKGYLVDTLGAAQDRFAARYVPMAAEFSEVMERLAEQDRVVASSERGGGLERE